MLRATRAGYAAKSVTHAELLPIGTIVALSDLVVTEVAPGQANGLPTHQPATTGTPATDPK
jgi:hypothetical protein